MSVKYGDNWIEAFIPIVTVSEANCTEHWTKRHKRHKLQKSMIALVLGKFEGRVQAPCKITLTRYGAKELDRHDNLPMSMKYILDEICAIITGDHRPGRADDDKSINVFYDQKICKKKFVEIYIEFDNKIH